MFLTGFMYKFSLKKRQYDFTELVCNLSANFTDIQCSFLSMPLHFHCITSGTQLFLLLVDIIFGWINDCPDQTSGQFYNALRD